MLRSPQCLYHNNAVQVARSCQALFGVQPRPDWMPMSFGLGADYRHVANIIFMENEKDPWHVGTSSIPAVGGVNGTVVRMVTKGGAHHQDLRFTSEFDTPEVRAAREFEISAIRGWLRGA